MIERIAAARLKKFASTFRSVAVIGPRQSGKTTLCRRLFPDKPYVSLENPDILDFATSDPRGFLRQYSKGAILDEIQRAPIIFSYLQQLLDETRKKGLFILTGSNNFLIQENITQTLSGRIAYLQLLPLSLRELAEGRKLKTNYQWHILNGGYPEPVMRRINPADWYPAYINTYIERDVRQLKSISNYALFLKFLRLTAGRTGQQLNLTSLGNDCGIDQKTAASWLSILQSGFVIYLLRPYFENFNKRVSKTPKLYFYDCGVACSLLGITKPKELATHPLRGFLFENLMITEFLKNRMNSGLQDNLYYWRDKTGNEVDLVLENAGTLTAIELKAGETISGDYFRGLNYFASLDSRPVRKELIYGGKQTQQRSSGISIKSWDTEFEMK